MRNNPRGTFRIARLTEPPVEKVLARRNRSSRREDQRLDDLAGERPRHHALLRRNCRHRSPVQERAPYVEKLLILVRVEAITEQSGNPTTHPVRRAHPLVAIGRDAKDLLIVRAQTERRLDRRDVREKLIYVSQTHRE